MPRLVVYKRVGKILSVVAIVAAIGLYVFAQTDDADASFLKPAAFGVVFFSLVLAGRAFGAIVRFPLQILMLVGCWLIFITMFFTQNMGVAPTYLSLILCIAATVSYNYMAYSRKEKRLIYGLFALAVALPAAVALLDSTTFETVFGIGSSRPMIIAALVACALYASALIVWLPHPKAEQ